MNSTKLALSGSNIKSELGIPEDILQIEADSGQLNQVISNLIINADLAMPESGNIKACVDNINIGTKDSLSFEEGRYV